MWSLTSSNGEEDSDDEELSLHWLKLLSAASSLASKAKCVLDWEATMSCLRLVCVSSALDAPPFSSGSPVIVFNSWNELSPIWMRAKRNKIEYVTILEKKMLCIAREIDRRNDLLFHRGLRLLACWFDCEDGRGVDLQWVLRLKKD